jgi:hypothetical protein
MTTPAWDPDDYDRRIKAERTAARNAIQRPTRRRLMNRTVEGAPGMPRGEATDEELQRRQRAERYLAGQSPPDAPEQVSGPQPRQKPNGRWVAKCIRNGVYHSRTFDTEAQAREFIRQIKEGR